MKINAVLLKIAYKKLKSSLYYDKTQSIVRDALVTFETQKKDIDQYLERLAQDFLNPETRKKLFHDILNSISYYVFPKSLVSEKSKMIKNYSQSNIKIKENQYFIDMDIRGHILGVLWLMLIGYRVDQKMYAYSYGNRIRKNLYNEFSEMPTYSPYLFEPYFQQYESWRDTAMDVAMRYLHSGQDVVVLTMDFKRFYYSVDITQKLLDEIYEQEIVSLKEDCEELKALNDFIFSVIERYAKQFDEFNQLNILPIGFLPSNVLANYALKNFDKAILDGWNPLYFGRYVDDIIIVDKIDAPSDLYQKSQNNELEAEDIIAYFLEQCSGWKGLHGVNCQNEETYALLQRHEDNLEKKKENGNGDRKEDRNEDRKGDRKEDRKEGRKGDGKEDGEENGEKNGSDKLFMLNKLYNPTANDRSKMTIKNEKVRIFYFRAGESDALITCFKENISKNKSEFRHMPEDETVFQKDDYSQIYDLQNDETINKFRGITGISIDKYELSKLLGKHLRICGMITDVKETGFEKQMSKILNERVLIENYNVWEKIVEILVMNESWDGLKDLIQRVIKAIDALEYQDEEQLFQIKQTMQLYLYSILSRAMALVWGKQVDLWIDSLAQEYADRQDYVMLSKDEWDSHRRAYCRTRMVDKSVTPILVDMLQMDRIYETKSDTLNLCNFEQMMAFSKHTWISNYFYYPYLVTMYDFSMIHCMEELKKEENPFCHMTNIYRRQMSHYVKSNYRVRQHLDDVKQLVQVEKLQYEGGGAQDNFLVKIGNDKKDKLRLAIANVRLNHDNFKKVVIDRPNRSYQRYKNLSKIINEAIEERADMLIMPEAYLPFEWLAIVARTCAKNNLAVVTGIEHMKVGTRIFNLTAVILPYEDLANKSAFISFHLKTHYAPAEKQEINGYRLEEVKGRHYELYQWHDCYFPVYCCYELTAIMERAIFQSYADFLIAIEWNKDIHYYSNILESLSRDLHCYCIQVNSSDYGDSRITKPSKTEEKDIVRTKGGVNSTILVDEIDIAKMRDFQLKEYPLQAYDKNFKPTPPGFQPEIVLKKIKGESVV